MGPPVLRPRTAFLTVGALCAVVLAVSALLVAVDWLNHSVPSVTHVAALGLSTFSTGLVGALDKNRAPWFGWLAYGTMLPSAILGLGLGAGVAVTGKLPHDANFREVLVASLLIFAGAFPAALRARRRARGP